MCTSGSRVGGVGGGGEQGGSWQDDSALHGKHLPPSPRRQPSKSSLKKPKQNSLTASPPATAAVPAKDNKVPNLLPKIENNTWTLIAPMNVARRGAGVAVYNGKRLLHRNEIFQFYGLL